MNLYPVISSGYCLMLNLRVRSHAEVRFARTSAFYTQTCIGFEHYKNYKIKYMNTQNKNTFLLSEHIQMMRHNQGTMALLSRNGMCSHILQRPGRCSFSNSDEETVSEEKI